MCAHGLCFAAAGCFEARIENNVDRCNLNIKIFPYARSLCEPLGSVWVMREGRCIMGLTCTKGYTEEECKKHCSTKATTVSAKTAINIQSGSSIRTRRPRTTEAMQIKR
nr:uncharacterized protein LOC26531155 [Drosophila virilis]